MFTRSEHTAAWWPIPEVRFLRVWGRPARSDFAHVVATLERDIAVVAPRHASLVDVRALDDVSESLFEELPRWVVGHRPELAARITRSAIVHSRVTIGALVAGYQKLALVPFEARAFASGLEALSWLGLGPTAVTSLWHAWETCIDRELGTSLAARVGAWLRGAPPAMRLADCAKALAVSSRSLQRALEGDGSSFRALVLDERVARAKKLLATGDAKLLSVAFEVGFSKVEQLNHAFVRREGTTAAGYRARVRG